MKKLFIFALFLKLNLYAQDLNYLQQKVAIINFKTMLQRQENKLGSSSFYYIKKLNNSSFRIESRVSLNSSQAPKTIVLLGMYSIYDNCTNEPLGYLNYDIDIYNDCYINEFHIHPKYRNKKIGKLLLNFAIEKFKEKKIKTLRLVAIPYNENEMTERDLIKYYEKFRFKKSGAFMHLQLDNNITSKL